MEIILALCLGVTLSAASGFRLFLPPLALSLAALHGDFELSAGFDWVGTYPPAIALGDVNPLLQWSLVAIAGGDTAGLIETFAAMTRAASTQIECPQATVYTQGQYLF